MDTRVFLPEHIFEICETSCMSIKSVRGPKIMVPLKDLSQKPPPPSQQHCTHGGALVPSNLLCLKILQVMQKILMCIKALPIPNQENATGVIEFTEI